MSIRKLTAFGLAGAFAVVAGCSEEPAANYADEDRAGTPSAPIEGPTRAAPPAYAGQAQSGDESAGEIATSEPESDQVERTEFAAFDSNSDGALSEREFDSSEARSQVNLRNMTFAQVDRNGDGTIDAQEFESAKASGDSSERQGLSLDEPIRE